MALYPSIRIEGGLLGPDILDQLLAGELPGQRAGDFGLNGKRNLTDEIAAAFADARALWGVFQHRLERVPADDLATSVTRDAWAIPFLGLLGFELRYNQKAYDIDGLTFAISHRAGERGDSPPVQIVGARQELGRVPATGRPRLAPHSLVQEYLNRTENLWGIVTNGQTLRLLRDCTYVRRQAYIEFDLPAILDEQRFQDFAALFRLVHRTRFPRTAEDAGECLLEKYYLHSVEQGGRVRDRLREGVEECLVLLANGFLRHRANDELRRRVGAACTGNERITPETFYRQLLILVYRFLFLLVSEDRGLLSADLLYRDHYSIGRLRRLLEQRAAFTDHDDLWQSLRVLWLVLIKDQPQPALDNQPMAAVLGLPVLNGDLFAPEPLDGFSISNRDLLEAFWRLAWYQETSGGAPRRVNYAALDVEELGSVYESLLEFHPAIEVDHAGRTVFALVTGSERKTTGSYYTPPELVAELIKSALEPVLEDRLKACAGNDAKEKAILSIRVCDPACGSGHFLLAAARRLGKELARVRTGEDEPAPERVRESIRDCIAHCIYGVDKNPLAVDLCRVALWLEGHTADKPLTFLDHRIRCGDSLVGVFDLDVLQEGIPDDAFKPLEGDDTETARRLKAANRSERRDLQRGQRTFTFDPAQSLNEWTRLSRELDAIADDSPEAIRRKKDLFEKSHAEDGWRRRNQACDLWTAAFFQPLREGEPAITTAVLAEHISGRPVDPRIQAQALSVRQRFFHWPLEFPEVFADGGFDVALGNPPWERVKLQEKEFFVTRDAQIANAPNKAARDRMIRRLAETNPTMLTEFHEAVRAAEGASGFLRSSTRFPLCGRGDINTYTVFAELIRSLIASAGRVGCIVPSGIATDDTTKFFFQDLIESRSLASLYDFENRKAIFPGVHRSYKFCLLTMTAAGGAPASGADFAFFLHDTAELKDAERRFSLSPEEISLLNPNTRTCPIFRSPRDAELCKSIRRRVPTWASFHDSAHDSWRPTIRRVIDINQRGDLLFTSDDHAEFQNVDSRPQVVIDGLQYLRMYEGKMIDIYNHRLADAYTVAEGQRSGRARAIPKAELGDPNRFANCRAWIAEHAVTEQLPEWGQRWLFAYMDVCSVTNERTVIGTIVPWSAPTFSLRVLADVAATPGRLRCLLANFLSFAFDFYVRQFVGGLHLSDYIMTQTAILSPSTYQADSAFARGMDLDTWCGLRVLELTYTAWDLEPFAQDCGYDGPPFRWDDERRFWLRAELDAAFFHLYLPATPEGEWKPACTADGAVVDESPEQLAELKRFFPTPRDAVEYLMETFPVVKRKDIDKHGTYRTKEAILDIYDAMQEASRTCRAYQTRLDPPPADPRVAHPARQKEEVP